MPFSSTWEKWCLKKTGGDERGQGHDDEQGDLEEFRYQRKLRAMEDVKEFRMVDVLTVYLQQIKS